MSLFISVIDDRSQHTHAAAYAGKRASHTTLESNLLNTVDFDLLRLTNQLLILAATSRTSAIAIAIAIGEQSRRTWLCASIVLLLWHVGVPGKRKLAAQS